MKTVVQALAAGFLTASGLAYAALVALLLGSAPLHERTWVLNGAASILLLVGMLAAKVGRDPEARGVAGRPDTWIRFARAGLWAAVVGLATTQVFLTLDYVSGQFFLPEGASRPFFDGRYDVFVHAENFGVGMLFLTWPLVVLRPLPQRGREAWAVVRSCLAALTVLFWIIVLDRPIDRTHHDPVMYAIEGLIVVGATLPASVWRSLLARWRRGARESSVEASSQPRASTD
jgi:hypothetical protein